MVRPTEERLRMALSGTCAIAHAEGTELMKADSKRAATMSDVAQLAGVSVPTVSRVVSGSLPVSAAKRMKVEDAVAALNFRPHAAARALASRRSDIIAIVTGSTSQYGYAETIRGIELAARSDGYTVMITVVESAEPHEVERAVAATMGQALAGVVVLKFDPCGVAALRRLPSNVPVVALSGARDKSTPQAVIDEAHGAKELIAYLLSLGHKTVHHVRVPPSRLEDGRTTGWRKALKEAGAIVPPLLDATWDPESGRVIGRQIAAQPEITAVFCGNDEIAMGVIRGIIDLGRSVPGDVSVVGFDGHPLSGLWIPAITTARQDFVALGRRGFELLASHFEGGACLQFSTVRPELVIRDSAAPPHR